MVYIIRPTVSEDLSALATILEQTELFPKELLPTMIEPALSKNSRDIWFSYLFDDEVVGFLFCQPEAMTVATWNVLAIAVATPFQGQGIGQALMLEIEQQLRQQGAKTLIVETSGLPEFALTRRFYKKIGYRQEASIQDFYDSGDDKIVFWKSLL